jgi:hypothetical protein
MILKGFGKFLVFTLLNGLGGVIAAWVQPGPGDSYAE